MSCKSSSWSRPVSKPIKVLCSTTAFRVTVKLLTFGSPAPVGPVCAARARPRPGWPASESSNWSLWRLRRPPALSCCCCLFGRNACTGATWAPELEAFGSSLEMTPAPALVRCSKTLKGRLGSWQLLNVNELISFTLKPVQLEVVRKTKRKRRSKND